MCGIAGFVGPAVEDGRRKVEAMTDAIVHRGPDDAGWFGQRFAAQTQEVGLGHRRLSIIDLSGSPQPMASADGRYWMVFNGDRKSVV